MAPAYLENQIERSRRNLDLETIDVFYVHNPESQLAEVRREVFYERLRDAFAMLEKQVAARRIAYYGVATWSGFRLAEGSRDHMSLEEVEALAREAGGEQHHFRVVQLPFSLAMPEAFAMAKIKRDARPSPVIDEQLQCYERLGPRGGRNVCFLQIAGHGFAGHRTAGVLAANGKLLDLIGSDGPDGAEDLHFLVVDDLGFERRGRFHRHEREQLHHVVLDHVADGAGLVVIAAPAFDAQ